MPQVNYSDDPSKDLKIISGAVGPAETNETPAEEPKPSGADLLKQSKEQPVTETREPVQEIVEQKPAVEDIESKIDAHLQSMRLAQSIPQPDIQSQIPTPQIQVPPQEEIQYEAPDIEDPAELGFNQDQIEYLKKVTNLTTQQTLQQEHQKIQQQTEEEKFVSEREKSNKEVYLKYPELLDTDTGKVDVKDSPMAQAMAEAWTLIDPNDANAPIKAMKIAEMKIGVSKAKEEGAKEEVERQSRVQASGAVSTGSRPARTSEHKVDDLTDVQKAVARKMGLSPEKYSKYGSSGNRVITQEKYDSWSADRRKPAGWTDRR